MSQFSDLWDSTVKALATACVQDRRLVELMGKSEDTELNDEEKSYLKEVGKKFKDPYAMFNISSMIWRVEHAIADNRDSIAALSVSEIHWVLSDPEYFEQVFQSNEEDEEWKKLKALDDGLAELQDIKVD